MRDKQKRLYTTKTTQIYKYLELYSGPDYIIHFKYSGILNVTYVTMMYGLGLPILFPIAALTYFIFWSVERYGIAYTYQMPPALDDTLTKNALRMLSWAPVLFLLNGFWMLSNKQIFDSEINELHDSTDPMLTGHTLSTALTLNQAAPMLLIGVAFTIIILLRSLMFDTLRRYGFTISSVELLVDENLPNFFHAVKLTDADYMVYENRNLRKNYGFNMIPPAVEAKLDDK